MNIVNIGERKELTDELQLKIKKNEHIICFRNGIYDFKLKKFIRFQPEDFAPEPKLESVKIPSDQVKRKNNNS